MSGLGSVCVLCGGRGSASLLRELRTRTPRVHAVVNAYDDGRSTGVLRRLVPGMLGPSDIRKNLATLLTARAGGADIAALLELRLSPGTAVSQLPAVVSALRSKGAVGGEVARVATRLAVLVEAFWRWCTETQGEGYALGDFALGNIAFTGAYLGRARCFNDAVAELAAVVGCEGGVVNVTRGENRTLVALKASGEVLVSESQIVSAQGASPIVGLYLLAGPPDGLFVERLEALPFDARRRLLDQLDRSVHLSAQARDLLLDADWILYGPGTPHSSLLPSLRTEGLCEAIARSRARVKALVLNLAEDADTVGMGAGALVECVLRYLGDVDNQSGVLTHVLYDGRAPLGPPPAQRHGARWIEVSLASQTDPGVHDGAKTIDALLEHADVEDQAP